MNTNSVTVFISDNAVVAMIATNSVTVFIADNAVVATPKS